MTLIKILFWALIAFIVFKVKKAKKQMEEEREREQRAEAYRQVQVQKSKAKSTPKIKPPPRQEVPIEIVETTPATRKKAAEAVIAAKSKLVETGRVRRKTVRHKIVDRQKMVRAPR